MLGTAPWELESAETVMVFQVVTMIGDDVVTGVQASFPPVLLPAASVTVTVIVCGPVARNVPAAGFWVTVNCVSGAQLSVAPTPATILGNAPWQLESAETVIGSGVLTIPGPWVPTPLNEPLPP